MSEEIPMLPELFDPEGAALSQGGIRVDLFLPDAGGQFALPDRDPDSGRFLPPRRKTGRGKVRGRCRRVGKKRIARCIRKPEETP